MSQDISSFLLSVFLRICELLFYSWTNQIILICLAYTEKITLNVMLSSTFYSVLFLLRIAA